MEPNSFYIHISIKDSDLRTKVNFKDKAAKTKGFPEVLKTMVKFLVARSNASKPVGLEEAKKMFKMDDADIEFEIQGEQET
jgi:hypothetical protein